MSETELAERCRQGDRAAFQQLYEQYAGWLMAVCVRYAGEREAARDILHDGFLKVFRSFSLFSYRGEGSLRAWLTRIMVNESLEFLREKERQDRTVLMEELPDTIPDTEECEWERIPQARLMRFIEELPTGYRTVFNLYVMEGKSHKEIAGLLGITERTSSSQLYRAKAQLIKKINEYIEKET